MRRAFILVISILLMPAAAHDAFAQQADAGGRGTRVALIIGNANYPNADPKLTQPIGNNTLRNRMAMVENFFTTLAIPAAGGTRNISNA